MNIVYFPQLGFLITLPIGMGTNGNEADELGSKLGFQLQFQSEKVYYFKNGKMRGKKI